MSTLTRAIIVEVDFQMMTEKVTSPTKIKIKCMPNFHIMLDDVVSRDLELSTKEHNQRIFIILNHNKKILKVKLMKLEDLPCLLPNLVYILINKETIMILIQTKNIQYQITILLNLRDYQKIKKFLLEVKKLYQICEGRVIYQLL